MKPKGFFHLLELGIGITILLLALMHARMENPPLTNPRAAVLCHDLAGVSMYGEGNPEAWSTLGGFSFVEITETEKGIDMHAHQTVCEASMLEKGEWKRKWIIIGS